MDDDHGDQRPLLGEQGLASDHGPAPGDGPDTASSPPTSWARRNQWIVLALTSGACAAFNGVFAKLTTTELTSSFADTIAHFLKLQDLRHVFEVGLRCIFFGLNLVFNGIMWTLFTAALARGNSTTQVSVINTSSNFVITALLGLAIFSESLPPLWWAGAALLVAGNVIIGRKDEGTSAGDESAAEAVVGNEGFAPVPQQPGIIPEGDEDPKDDDEDLDIVDLELGDDVEGDEDVSDDEDEDEDED